MQFIFIKFNQESEAYLSDVDGVVGVVVDVVHSLNSSLIVTYANVRSMQMTRTPRLLQNLQIQIEIKFN